LRLFAIALAAALVPMAPLSIVLLLQVRDGIYGRAIADARARLTDALQRRSGRNCPDAPGGRKLDRPRTARAGRVGEPRALGGDAVGRVGAAVNRLAQRLREERGRTRSQIEALEAANQKLREAREDLARSEQLAGIGRLAAGVAHEVGNPVSALIGYAALMRERIAQGKDVDGYAERIEREASRIDRILRDLLDLA